MQAGMLTSEAELVAVRAERKVRYERYREKAMAKYRDTAVKVTDTADVLCCEGGAFVEAMVWVPDLEL